MAVGRIALVGGDEFRRGCEEMDAVILASTGADRPRVSIVPTAAAAQNPAKAASNGVFYFSALGAEASAVMVLGPADAADLDLIEPLELADVVYLTGGDPSHLLETLRGSPLLDAIRAALARGAVVAGSSAGAMVLGPRMRFRGWTDALGVVDGVTILPHHERADPESVAAELERQAPPGAVILGIDAMTACYGAEGDWQVVGTGSVTVYEDGAWRRYGAGESIPLHA